MKDVQFLILIGESGQREDLAWEVLARRLGLAFNWDAVGDLIVRVFCRRGPRAATANLIVAADSARLFGCVFLVFGGPLRQMAKRR
jgi:hypothetical protein